MNHADQFYRALDTALQNYAVAQHDLLAYALVDLRNRGGRLFCLGVGGGAANAAHAVNDFRKLCGIEAYAPTDGVSELTARANDEGWHTIFVEWLHTSRFGKNDALMIFSVGGGTRSVSACIFEAVSLARLRGATIMGIVGKRDGITAQQGSAVVVLETPPEWATPVTEAAQVAVLHALVSDPRLQVKATKW